MSRVTRRVFLLAVFSFLCLRALAIPIAGDVDNSGAVNASDIQFVINAALGIAVPSNVHADLDYSAQVSAVDVQLVINAALDLPVDVDRDGLVDSAEGRIGTDLRLFDTDGDAIGDGQEMLDGTDPLTPEAGSLPPAPESVAPEAEAGVATTVANAAAFLYSGDNPIQSGLAPGTMVRQRIAVVHGRVLARSGAGLAGVRVSVLGHDELGHTLSRDDGAYDLAVNGGGALTFTFDRTGFLPASRTLEVPWQDFVSMEDVVLVQVDAASTRVDFSEPIQVARGTAQTDSDGTRRATLLFPQAAKARLTMPGRKSIQLPALTVRLTEYTVGNDGPAAMPAELPSQSAYTYAMELSADEATKLGAKELTFSSPLYFYVENFLGFPTGLDVPVGYYDRERAAWIPCPDGRVIEILSVAGGMATIDTDGDSVADGAPALAALGFTDAERSRLATLYSAGQTLWRAPIEHFSPFDLNWPTVLPPGAVPPSLSPPEAGSRQHTSQTGTANGLGTVDYANQTFKESIPIAGTPYWLSYSSDRVPGFTAGRTIDIPLSGATVPGPLKRIELEVEAAGQLFTETFSKAANQSYRMLWDGQDLYGRDYQGSPRARTRVKYVYDTYYSIPPSMAASFGYPGGSPVLVPSRQERVLWQQHDMGFYPESSAVGVWSARGLALGGWTLNVHHCYDPATRILYFGDGRRSDDQVDVRRAVRTAAGTGEAPTKSEGNGDGGPAVEARLSIPVSTSVAPDGSVYIADAGTMSIRKIDPEGIITTVAGGRSSSIPYTEGEQATDVYIGTVTAVAAAPDGSFYFGATGIGHGALLCHVLANGQVFTSAGGGFPPDDLGDGLAARDAHFTFISGIALSPDGTIYISDSGRIRRIGPDGVVSTAAGDGVALAPATAAGGDGGPAVDARLIGPHELGLGPDGSLYIADTTRVRRITPEGIMETVAGTGNWPDGGVDGSGGPALDAAISAYGLTVLPDGTLLIGEGNYNRIRRVGTDGIITPFAGKAGPGGFGGDEEPAPRATFDEIYSVAAAPGGEVFVTDWGNRRLRAIAAVMPNLGDDGVVLASEGGRVLYEFDELGRHLQTTHSLTGGMLQMFLYDDQGRLTKLVDGNGNETTIERGADGTPTAIVSPYGQRTALTLDVDGYLETVTNPALETTQFAYGDGGLLETVTSAKGVSYDVTYDEDGFVVGVGLPTGGEAALARNATSGESTVNVQTPTGRVDTYENRVSPDGTEYARNTPPDGLACAFESTSAGLFTSELPDGTSTTVQDGPDPRFGMQCPLPVERTIQTPAGSTVALGMTREVTLSDPENPMSVTSLTDTMTANGVAATTVYDAAAHTMTATSPAGRQRVTEIDDLGRTVRKSVAGLADVAYAYDTHGRLSTVTRGTFVTTFAYDADGFLRTITDPLGRTVTFDHDAAGRLVGQTLTDGRYVSATTDSHGNAVGLTPPGGLEHGYTFNDLDQAVAYEPPAVGGGGTGVTLFSYNGEQELDQVSYPDGSTALINRDAAGRVASVTCPSGSVAYSYEAGSGKLSSITGWDGSTLSFTYDSALLLLETWSGAANGYVSRAYDQNLLLTTLTLSSGHAVTYSYDADGLMVQAGDESLTWNADNGMLTDTQLGTVSTSFLYDPYGNLAGLNVTRGGATLYASTMVYDAIGRVTSKTETTVDGTTAEYTYTYLVGGQLGSVYKNGTHQATFSYDENENRVGYQSGADPVVSAAYDDQDRLVQSGTTTFTYTPTGNLSMKTTGAQTTSYTFDGLGRLSGVTLPDGKLIAYLYDGADRRIGKQVDGTLVQAFLYQSDLLPCAELDAAGNLVSYFVYGSNSHAPDYMVRGGETYRIVVDHLGSPRAVVNVATGAVAQRMDFDAFGVVLTDTNPGFQPFGFAGGLYDADTGLVHFGERDYDAAVGRWIAKDPMGFRGAHTNLYAYAMNDPVNIVDPNGTGPGLGLLAIPGLIPYLKQLLTTPWIAGADEGLVMARAGIEFGDEAYRVQMRLFGNVFHAALNRQYGFWRGLHVAWNDMHIYLNRIVFQSFKSSMEMAIDWKTKLPYFRAPYKVINYFEGIRNGLGKALPYVRTAGRFMGAALRILGPVSAAATYDDVSDEHEAWTSYLREYGGAGAPAPQFSSE